MSGEAQAPGPKPPTDGPLTDGPLGPLPLEFYARPTLEVARSLLGTLLCYAPPTAPAAPSDSAAPSGSIASGAGTPAGDGGLRIGRIVEVEAYLGPEDRASHARLTRRGGALVPTPRSALMFGRAGRAYMYLIYGMHHCFNVVAHSDGQVGAVLIRALAPVTALEGSRLRGPARLCSALGLDLRHNGHDLLTSAPGPHGALFLAPSTEGPLPDSAVAAGPRIGVDYAGDDARLPYRLCERGSPFLSRKP